MYEIPREYVLWHQHPKENGGAASDPKLSMAFFIKVLDNSKPDSWNRKEWTEFSAKSWSWELKNIIYASLKMMDLDVHTRFSTRIIKGHKKRKRLLRNWLILKNTGDKINLLQSVYRITLHCHLLYRRKQYVVFEEEIYWEFFHLCNVKYKHTTEKKTRTDQKANVGIDKYIVYSDMAGH